MTVSDRHSCQQTCTCSRVLLVDDEPGILFAYRKLLEQQGLSVDSCDCLCEALAYLENHDYLAVVADLHLQGTDTVEGFDLIKAVRQRQPLAGIIVASADSDHSSRKKATDLGANLYLEKPVHPTLVLEMLMKLRDAVDVPDLFPAIGAEQEC